MGDGETKAQLVPSFRSSFAGQSDGLLTNEYAFAGSAWDGPGRTSSDWEVTSGSLFVRNGVGWTGVPDDANDGRTPVGAASTNVTNSAVFRARSVRADFGNVDITLRVKVGYFLPGTSTTAAQDWDGVHLFLRYLSPFNLYYASVARRDGRVVIKRKISGIPPTEIGAVAQTAVAQTANAAASPGQASTAGPGYYEGPEGNVSNHGAYYTLAQTPAGAHPWQAGLWRSVGASIITNPDGTTTIVVALDGIECLRVTDDASRYASEWRGQHVGWDGTIGPITQPGRVGLRCDNVEVTFDDVVVRAM